MCVQIKIMLFLGLVLASALPNGSRAQGLPGPTQQRDDDAKLIDGLRRRRLFELAELFCLDQLKSTTIDATTQSMLTVELMKTQTAKAILAPAEQRATDWQSVHDTAEAFLKSNPEHPRTFLVEVQLALSHLAHGRLLRQEISADIAPDSARQQALQEIQFARERLGNLQRKINKAVPNQRARSLGAHDLSVQQLLRLNNNIRYQLAVCNLNRAQLYELNDRLNRIDALNGVTQRLTEVQRETSEGQPLWWKTKLGQLECLRLLGKVSEAVKLIESLPAKGIPNPTLQSLLEQKIRLAILWGDEGFSRSLLDEAKKLTSHTAQLDLAIIELAVDLAARASTDQQKQEWLNFGSLAGRAIEQAHGAYWGRRADLVLIESAGGISKANRPDKGPVKMIDPATPATGSIVNTEMDQLIRLAEAAARKENWNDAIKAFDLAAAKARTLGVAEQAVRLDVRVSQMLEKKGNHESAASRLIESAKQNPSLSMASAVHLRGCWNYAQTLSTDEPDRKQVWHGILSDHVRTWPKETSTNQARIWLAGQDQSEQNFQAAFDTYLQVAVDSPYLMRALQQSFGCAETMLQDLRRFAKPTPSTAAKLIAQYSEKQTQLAESDIAFMQLELYRAELDLRFGSRRPNADLGERLASAESSEDASLRNAAKAIHAVSSSLAAPQQAKQLVKQIGADLAALELCERCLVAVVQNSEIQTGLESAHELRVCLAEQALQLTAMKEPANTARRAAWMSRKSQSLVSLNRHAESIEVLTKLEKEFPKNAAVQMELARAMTAQFGKDAPEKPLAKWRQVAARLKSGTANWYEAKFQVAFLLQESGQTAEAAKLLRYIQVIPGWENSTLKPKFEQLLRTVTSAR